MLCRLIGINLEDLSIGPLVKRSMSSLVVSIGTMLKTGRDHSRGAVTVEMGNRSVNGNIDARLDQLRLEL